jgi:hypothetical protein
MNAFGRAGQKPSPQKIDGIEKASNLWSEAEKSGVARQLHS